VNFDSLRRLQSKLAVASVAAAALVLTSCGGGGATSSPNNVGSLQLLPAAASIYAGVPYTANIVGGRKPYLVTSNEETLIKLGFTTEQNEFTIVANNPGVVNVGLDPAEVPRRTVNIQVRDSNGVSISNEYSVLQNFFTGYGQSYSSTCTAGAAGAPAACAGTDTIITLLPVSNGVLYGNREFQLDKVRGEWQFVVEDPNVTPQLVDRLRVRTDQLGRAQARVRVLVNAQTQQGTYRLTDVATGVTTNLAFSIIQQQPIDAVTFLPANTYTFTGALTTTCGSGSVDVFVYGGKPPYRLEATNGTQVSPATLSSIGSRFTITVPAGLGRCGDSAVVVTDSVGATGLINVKTELGNVAPTPPPAMVISPASIASLACGTSGQATVVGGTGSYSATSSHPRITATVAGSVLTISRLTGDGAGVFPTTGSVSVTDGASVVSITITATPATCP